MGCLSVSEFHLGWFYSLCHRYLLRLFSLEIVEIESPRLTQHSRSRAGVSRCGPRVPRSGSGILLSWSRVLRLGSGVPRSRSGIPRTGSGVPRFGSGISSFRSAVPHTPGGICMKLSCIPGSLATGIWEASVDWFSVYNQWSGYRATALVYTSLTIWIQVMVWLCILWLNCSLIMSLIDSHNDLLVILCDCVEIQGHWERCTDHYTYCIVTMICWRSYCVLWQWSFHLNCHDSNLLIIALWLWRDCELLIIALWLCRDSELLIIALWLCRDSELLTIALWLCWNS